eukprot:TRINITY_DN1683_c0_g1_i1.p2 TRINITY_DN1683_c0_g1~~TRINITY_DN1683_c0_g1_i1.p2  ORF type:complete len:202 (-),score=14.99 TRINITY_DN1683_c0_g1_i1:22-627(-)
MLSARYWLKTMPPTMSNRPMQVEIQICSPSTMLIKNKDMNGARQQSWLTSAGLLVVRIASPKNINGTPISKAPTYIPARRLETLCTFTPTNIAPRSKQIVPKRKPIKRDTIPSVPLYLLFIIQYVAHNTALNVSSNIPETEIPLIEDLPAPKKKKKKKKKKKIRQKKLLKKKKEHSKKKGIERLDPKTGKKNKKKQVDKTD